MSEGTKRGLAVLAAGLGLGMAADGLLRAVPWGVSLPLWIAGLIAAGGWLRHRHGQPPSLAWCVGSGAMLACACLMAWRDSGTLRALDLLAVVLTYGLTAQPVGALLRPGLARETGWTGLTSAAGLFTTLGQDIQWAEIPRERGVGQAAAIGRGLLLACPLLAVFGGLLASADAVFARGLRDLLQIDPAALATQLWATALGASCAAGWLRQALRPADMETPDAAGGPRWTVGLTESAVALGSLALLFAAFVLVQFRFFFGGRAYVHAATGLTYADYARGGFFELAAVSALVLPLLLAFHRHLRRDTGRAESVYRVLAGVLVGLLAVIMASAFRRMALYQDAYGQTELRFYVTALMVWLAALFAGFLGTVLRGRAERFAAFGLASAAVAVFLLNAVNPDARIVAANAARASAGKPFDAAYAKTLSADSVPALAAALPRLPPNTQAQIISQLAARKPGLDADGWRNWNWGRMEARRTLDALRLK